MQRLPQPLLPLRDLAYNLWWTWDATAAGLFASIDPAKWHATGHNPVLLLQRLTERRTRQLAADRAFVADVRRTWRRLRAYLRSPGWHQRQQGRKTRGMAAYFSMEFGLHESLPIFAGGLGILAGDHLKSASDLGLPLVGVGIFWRQGYVRQETDAAGRQVDMPHRLLPEHLPLTEALAPSGRPVRVRIPVGSDTVVARAWRLDVGRVRLFLLDTNLPANAPRHRRLTQRLYTGDPDTRIRQELVLGIGGWRLLRALGVPVTACHLNEGHAAFCLFERLADEIKRTGGSYADAARRVAATTVFTTHTPVPEGNETFQPRLVERYLGHYTRRLGIGSGELLALGRADAVPAVGTEKGFSVQRSRGTGVSPVVQRGTEKGFSVQRSRGTGVSPVVQSEFGMTPLALRLSAHRNGVSKMHGQVSRMMWRDLWPKRSIDRVPIGSITNGIHLRTWLHPKMADLLDEYLPAGWEERQEQASVWAAVRKIPGPRLWDMHIALKEELLDFVRRRLREQLSRHGAGARKIAAAGGNLDPNALTIGFARRFAAYKRATLIFSDLRRFERLVNNARRPVQIIFAGKAHPADAIGKALLAGVVKQARSARFKGRVVFLENYDMEIARHLVAGVDVWLNTPQRPKEASGTSGMKPALHGGLNLSILDGWWPEGCRDGKNGWSIGGEHDHLVAQASRLCLPEHRSLNDTTAAADKRDHLVAQASPLSLPKRRSLNDTTAAADKRDHLVAQASRLCLPKRRSLNDGTAASDKRDARSLYRRLEHDVIPLYYDRDADGRPAGWIRMMKESLSSVPPAFNSQRMVKAYYRRYYLPAFKSAAAPERTAAANRRRS